MAYQISLDIWGTLLKANPELATIRSRIFREVLGAYLTNALDQIRECCSYVKRTVDGVHKSMAAPATPITATDACEMVILRLLGPVHRATTCTPLEPSEVRRAATEVAARLTLAFVEEASPTINEDIVGFIDRFASQHDAQINFFSNTCFIPSDVTQHFLLGHSRLCELFSFGLYSDLGDAKPHPASVERLLMLTETANRQKYWPTDGIIHIGDDAWTDSIGRIKYIGANASVALTSHIIQSNNFTTDDARIITCALTGANSR